MKRPAIITYLLAIALLCSACVYKNPDDIESTPPHSDTSPSFDSIEHSIPTENTATPARGDTCTVGPYKFEYGVFYGETEDIYGWMLVSCENSVENAVVPSEVMGFPVISIGVIMGAYPPFSENTALKSIVIPDTVVYIGYCAFRYCKNLTDITLSCNYKSVGDYIYSDGRNCLLAGTSVTFLEVPEGVTRLSEFVFMESSLESLVLPSTLEIVEYYIFVGPFADTTAKYPLKEVFYRGTAEQCPYALLDQVAMTDATIYYLSETEPTEEGNFWHYVDGKPVIW